VPGAFRARAGIFLSKEYDMSNRRVQIAAVVALAATLAAGLIGPAFAQDPAAAKEVVGNPYGLGALWAQGDVVAKGTLTILVLFSIGSWYVLATKLVQSLRLARDSRLARRAVFQAETLLAGAQLLKAGSTFRYIAETGIAADHQHQGKIAASIDRNEWINASLQQAIDDVQARQQEGLAFLATVGSTAPFVGLFGTVWGIYHALTAIGIAGQASIDKVAGPVGEALIMTAIGLAVAVPAVLGYNWLVRRNKVILDAARRFGTDVNRVLLGAELIASRVPPKGPPTGSGAPAANRATRQGIGSSEQGGTAPLGAAV
jgi:biopolymer transport protein ExbB